MGNASLFFDRRYWAFFWTQFLGAFNDNFFKNALVIMVAFREVSVWGIPHKQVVAASTGIFILPMFLFSAFAGQLADKFSKPVIIKWVKGAEILFMAVGLYGFFAHRVDLLLLVLLFMGLHATFFGPVKYSILPQLLGPSELLAGTAYVEMGTFVAILAGTLAGGPMVAMAGGGPVFVGITATVIALVGFITSLFVPKLPPQDPDIVVSLNPVTPAAETYRSTRENRSVFLGVLGISWFWFFGAAYLTLLPTYTKEIVGGSELVVSLFLGAFCVGIAIGSVLCARLSNHRLELGLVPVGTIGMTVFGVALYFVRFLPVSPESTVHYGVMEVLARPGGVAVVVLLACMAAFGGFFTVPLYTLIQERSDPRRRSRVIAGNNILNAFFMVLCTVLLIVLQKIGFTTSQIFLTIAVLNAFVALYIYKLLPEFLFRFMAWIVSGVMYRVRVDGVDKLPKTGPALVVANHVSFVDWLLIASASPTPLRFVMYHGFMKLPVVGFLFRDAKVIPIAPAKEDKDAMDKAFDRISEELAAGEIVCIFPEGQITQTGDMNAFRRGVERILERNPVPVTPVAIVGMWGSFFSRKDGAAMSKPFRRVWSRVTLVVGDAVPAASATADGLAANVAALGGMTPPASLAE